MPCGRAAREEEAYRAENRNVPDRSASDDARRHIIDRPIYTRNRLSPLLLFLLLPHPLCLPFLQGVYVDVWVAMPRGGSRAPHWPGGAPKNLTSKRTRIIGDNAGVGRAP